MHTVDTNVLVRYVTNDNPEQAHRAMDLLGGTHSILVTLTVLLELEWVLRAVYKLPRERIQVAMLHILGLPNVSIERPEQISQALRWHHNGMDFAGALHLSMVGDAEYLATFGQQFVAQAAIEGMPVRLL